MDNPHIVKLPSFLRRTLRAFALKAYIRESGCELSRVGRSRNWQLKATFIQLQSIINFIDNEGEDSWLWVSKLLKVEYKHLSIENLLVVASRIDNLTVATLMAQTDCTLAQARKVLDDLEGLG